MTRMIIDSADFPLEDLRCIGFCRVFSFPYPQHAHPAYIIAHRLELSLMSGLTILRGSFIFEIRSLKRIYATAIGPARS